MNAETDIETQIRSQIEGEAVLLYMKGKPDAPQCGFSAQAAQALISCGRPFAFVDILSHPDIRAALPKIANWPTFPQLWVNGDLVGGADIIAQMQEAGELASLIEQATEATTETTQ